MESIVELPLVMRLGMLKPVEVMLRWTVVPVFTRSGLPTRARLPLSYRCYVLQLIFTYPTRRRHVFNNSRCEC